LRKAITFLVISMGLLVCYFTQSVHHTGFLVAGIVFLGLGLGNLLSIKAQERYLSSQPPEKD